MKEKFQEVKALLRRGWAQGALARNDRGVCSVDARDARCWCLGGAMVKVANGDQALLYAMRKSVIKALNGCDYVPFNDDIRTTIQDVLMLMDKVINAVE